ncbi:hypothetical protein C5167_035515 [Papaver somniferum]|uniref:Uncharacterized protein n=1 Tax=Papaver somniferum TaxID=3469 RepID=A0A4Y7KHE2_PAPSO|nr:hypothetical protein C5167_035515 [Papaver somniferum]
MRTPAEFAVVTICGHKVLTTRTLFRCITHSRNPDPGPCGRNSKREQVELKFDHINGNGCSYGPPYECQLASLLGKDLNCLGLEQWT